jgi:hypothetical protein
MFGTGLGGNQFARRIFKITNPNRKRPGPVAISVNKNVVSAEQVQIYWDNKLVTDPSQLYAMLAGIEAQGVEGLDPGEQRAKVLAAIANL